MRPVRWNKRIIIIAVVSFLLYLTFRYNYYQYVSEGKIPNAPAQNVWDFIADFRNMKLLQPSLHNFSILSESGNYDHWKYTVKYYEPLDDWPYLDTVGTADYSVKTNGNNYAVFSTHVTCYFGEMICMNTYSEFDITQVGKDTHYREVLNYQCPVILSSLCYSQVLNSRLKYMQRLEYNFK